MPRIGSDRVTDGIRNLFDPRDPNAVRLFAVLDGGVAGSILTDDETDPAWCVVRERGFGAMFVGGSIGQQELSQIVDSLTKKAHSSFSLCPGDKRLEILPPEPDIVSFGLEFTERPANGEGLEPFLGRVPRGCEIRGMDRGIFERCLWRDDVAGIYESPFGFLEKGIGFCLMRGDAILSEGYADFCSMGTMELRTITNERYRGLGYSTITCAHVVRACEERGYKTLWNCARTNVASASVARKLGYRSEREFIWTMYEAV